LGALIDAIRLVAQRPGHVVNTRLLAASGETAGWDWSESMAVGLSDPLGWCGATDPTNTAAYVAPPSGGPSCRLPTATSSPVTDEIAGRGADPAPMMAGQPSQAKPK
jgi:hypothetical protein